MGVTREGKQQQKRGGGGGTTSSSTKSKNKGPISKTAGSTNAGKKMLTTTLQVYYLLPQHLNVCVNGINSRLNPPHEEGSSNLMKMVHDELYSEAHTNKLLNCSPPLQDPLGGNCVNKVMLDIIHHTLQQLQKVLSSKTAKAESLHKVTTTTLDRHQMGNTIFGNSEAMEIYIGRSKTPKVCKIKVINLRLIKTSKEGCGLTHRV